MRTSRPLLWLVMVWLSAAANVWSQEIQIPEAAGFNAAGVPAYAGEHVLVYAHIDENLDAHLAHLVRWVRQRSISAQNVGVRDMARLLATDLTSLGFSEVTLVESAGHPGVWGYFDAKAEKTLVIYMMYDVQPVNPEDWQVPPFAGEVIDHPLGKVLMARAATNQKGPERAFLNALSSIIAVEGTLPVNLMVLAEGEEELGSPNFPEIVDAYAARLKTADGVFFPFNSQTPSGDVSLFLGVKGIVYFELEANGSASGGPAIAEIHGSYKAIADAPAWRLTQALASLTTADGNVIEVPGYYDSIRPPTEEEVWVFNGTVAGWVRREAEIREGFGIAEWIDGITGRTSLATLTFGTTLNIDGIWGGYTGEGVKTILPHKATAKLDSRLVPNQTPDEALRLIRAHLDANGFADILLRKISGYPPAQTSVDTPLVRAALGVFNKHGSTPSLSVRIAGSAPYYVFTDLGLPLIAAGMGLGAGAHAPDEFMVIEPVAGSRVAGLADVEKFYVDLLYALAAAR
ncbi:MAG: M20/M25/M40 family metallo-hydrolase [Gammaproteobacteria bacterium]|nr:M20/M25/M40 family metallo-hydrolase [Gammaproteobacteria bacterium]